MTTGEIIIYDVVDKEISSQQTMNGSTKINTENFLPGYYQMKYLFNGGITINTLLKF